MEYFDPTSQKIHENKNWSLGAVTHENVLRILSPEVHHIYEFMEKLSQSGFILVWHQTMANTAEKILQNHEYFSQTWLNWTAIIMNPETIARTAYQQSVRESGQGITIHRWSDALIIMTINKRDFPETRKLPDIDERLWDFVISWYLKHYGISPNCIYGYISGNTLHPNQTWTGMIKHPDEYL